jgi:hypothetical protein
MTIKLSLAKWCQIGSSGHGESSSESNRAMFNLFKCSKFIFNKGISLKTPLMIPLHLKKDKG